MPPIIVDVSVLVAAVVDTDLDGDWARSVTAEGPLIAPGPACRFLLPDSPGAHKDHEDDYGARWNPAGGCRV